MAITLILGLVGGSLMSRSMVRRIEAINQTSREIMSGDLSRRIPMDRSGDDFDELAGNLNTMLDRIGSLMEEVHRISDNIAHDLKTPLTRLRNSLEMLNTSEAEDAERRRTLIEQSTAEADGLLSTFDALLRIARIESGERRAAFAPVDLEQVLRGAVEFYAPLAEERGQELESSISASVSVLGDRHLLFQACANLLDNAIKYTPPQGCIEVSLTDRAGQPCLTIADSGPGIPEQERRNVFRRFYRLERSRGLPGNGLGLSLVEAVAKLHHAQLSMEDNEPGLRATMVFLAHSVTC